MRYTFRSAALAMVFGMVFIACGSGGGADVATLKGDGGATGGTPSPTMTQDEALMRFAKCMRGEGIEFPDPTVDEKGRFSITVPAGSEDGPDQATQDAMKTCGHLLPQGGGPGVGMAGADQAAFRDALLEFAKCMRDKGIDYPDPDFSGGGPVMIGGNLDMNDPDVRAAQEVCQPILDKAMPGDSGPAPAQGNDQS